jgi:hypothetical protein
MEIDYGNGLRYACDAGNNSRIKLLSPLERCSHRIFAGEGK